jgi:hypothetical protein
VREPEEMALTSKGVLRRISEHKMEETIGGLYEVNILSIFPLCLFYFSRRKCVKDRTFNKLNVK